MTTFGDIIDETICEESSEQVDCIIVKKVRETPVEKSSPLKRNVTNEKRIEWHTPRMEPPLANGIEFSFKKSNETIVSYFKTKDKYKMVNFLTQSLYGCIDSKFFIIQETKS